MANLFDPVTVLRGVGTMRAEQLKKLGIETVYDLISYFPRSYDDRTRLVTVSELSEAGAACFRATVMSTPVTSYIRKGLNVTKCMAADYTAQVKLVFFNQPHLAGSLRYGESYYFYGSLSGDYTGYQVTNPVVESAASASVMTRRIVPVYSLTAGVSNNLLVKLVAQALDACPETMPEVLPPEVRAAYHWMDVRRAYRAIHNPASMQELKAARERLIFEEFFIFTAGLLLTRARRVAEQRAAYPNTDLTEFYAALPFQLTNAQQRAIDDIIRDFQKGIPMNRLLQGDVGSGKTMVAAAAAYCAVKNHVQVALMAPTEILAEQHFAGLSKLFAPLGIRCGLLTGSMKPSEQKKIRAATAEGELDLLIGTHSLISETTQFRRLGLVIADEQHRFGVEQRAALASKGDAPHLLVLSATPIPRTLSLILYGDLDLSVINELPPGRQKVDTFLVNESMRTRINAFIRKHVANGNQVYIVCPAVDESEIETLKSAEQWAQALQQRVFPDLRVALLHGKMKGAEKERIMAGFQAGQYDILVATTVIEVGVDVPNATLMVIENADRFGLSQLHQLRGRVGRGKDKSYCVLISNKRDPDSQTRMRALCQTNDGFQIAEADLKLRGPGDFFGSRQSGLPAFKVANLEMDLDILRRAQQAAQEFIPHARLDSEQMQPLLQRIRALFDKRENQFN